MRSNFITVALAFLRLSLPVLLAATPNSLSLRNVPTIAAATPAAGGGVSTSYANTGGTGNRTSAITISTTLSFVAVPGGATGNLVDGTTSGATNFYFPTQSVSGLYLRFDFGSGRVIDEAKFYQQTSAGQGTWKWQGSNDASSWTDIGSSYGMGGTATQTITALASNVTAYRYYQILGVSGSTDSGPWIYEFEFKIY